MTTSEQSISRWDRQGLAATYILAAPILGGRVERWIDFKHHEIDFSRMLDNEWSHGERLMIQAANDLYNGDRAVGLDELASTLDDRNLRTILDAIKIRRGWVALEGVALMVSMTGLLWALRALGRVEAEPAGSGPYHEWRYRAVLS